MPALSKEKLVSLNPDKVFNIKQFVLNIDLWKNLPNTLGKTLKKHKKLAFNSNIQSHLSNTAKGIYIFTIEPEFPFMPTVVNFMYVGKVTSNNTFRQRFYEYVGAIGNENTRRNIQLLTNLWPGKTWVYVYELTLTDSEIEDIERSIYDSVIPPLNNKFTLKRAKNSRSLYN